MSLIIDDMVELGVTRASRWVFNCYVIHNHGRPIVVDPGLHSALADIEQILERIGPPSAIVATHGHSDHVAGVAALARRYDAPIFLPTVTLTYLGGVRARTPTPASVRGIVPTLRSQPFDWKGQWGLIAGARRAGLGASTASRWDAPAPAGALADGDLLPGAADWRVVATPEHTDDSISFWHSSSRALISGDAVLTTRAYAYHSPELVDEGKAAVTRLRLDDLPIAHVLPGHGPPVHDEASLCLQHPF